MPELPEVETVRKGLVPVMEGQVIVRAMVNRADLRWPFPERMAERLTGARVLALRRRSKYILADLSTGETLLVHLGMSGRMLISAPETPREALGEFHHHHPAPEKHDHVVFDMENGARVTFNDARRFGAMDLMQTATAEAHALLAGLGPEPLGNAFNEGYLAAKLQGKNTPVKSALLDQRLIAGLGNIYVCETLYRARVHPATKAGDLTKGQVAGLVPIIRDVLAGRPSILMRPELYVTAAALSAGIAWRRGAFTPKAVLYADIDNAAGLASGTAVRLSGVRVGEVSELLLLPDGDEDLWSEDYADLVALA